MQGLTALKDVFDIALAYDHDRHDVVTQSHTLVPPNHYLTAYIKYLL